MLLQPDRKLTAVLLALLFSFSPLTGFAAESHKESQTAHPRGLLYHCPMHPQIVSDKPGECPICHMRLVRYGSEDTSGGSEPVLGRVDTKISEASRGSLGIRTGAAEKRVLTKTIHAWGNIAHDPELYALQVEYLQLALFYKEYGRDRTKNWQRKGLLPWEKMQIRLNNQGLGADWIQTLEKAGEPDKRLILHEGMTSAWVYVKLQEKDLRYIKKGDAVTVQLTAEPGIGLAGKVEFIDEIVNDMNRTVRARVLLSQMPKNLKPHMRVEVTIRTDLGDSIAVPEEAIIFTGKGTLVFVDEAGTFKPREVTLGEKADGYYQVTEGLMPGEKIAIDGNFFIDSDSRLKTAVVAASRSQGVAS